MTAPILVLGHGGMLGRAWMAQLEELGREARGLGTPEVDLADPSSIDEAVAGDLSAVVNCAAFTDVDGAEEHEARATLINGEAVGHLVRRCDALSIPLVHYSTDYVFDGRASSPYRTDHPTSPVNAYGRSKRVGERHLLRSDGPHLLVRTSWLYAPWGKNFVRTIARLANERERLRVVNDQRGRPSSAEQLARVSLALLDAGARGVFHGTDAGECTWFDLAREIVRQLGASCAVEPCGSDEFPRPAERPAYSVLDVAETEAVVGPLDPWQGRLRSVLDRL